VPARRLAHQLGRDERASRDSTIGRDSANQLVRQRGHRGRAASRFSYSDGCSLCCLPCRSSASVEWSRFPVVREIVTSSGHSTIDGARR